MKNIKKSNKKDRLAMLLWTVIVLAGISYLYMNSGPQTQYTANTAWMSRSAEMNASMAYIIKLTNRSNALYGVPNSGAYINFLDVGPYSNRSQGLVYYFGSEYGLNFTAPVMAGSNELPLTYVLALPNDINDSSAPVAMLISVFRYANTSRVNFPLVRNGVFYVNNSNYIVTKDRYNFTVNMSTLNISIPNTRTTLITLWPAYGNLELSQINIEHNDCVIIAAIWGINKKYDQNYTIDIGKHIYSQLECN